MMACGAFCGMFSKCRRPNSAPTTALLGVNLQTAGKVINLVEQIAKER